MVRANMIKTVVSRRAIVCFLWMLACVPFSGFSADPIGYVWPKKDLLVPDTNKGEFKPLQAWRAYPLVKKIDAGYVVLWENTNGSPRLALVSLQDRMGNPTASPDGPPLTLRGILGVEAQRAYIPLDAGEKYPVTAQSNGCYSIAYIFNVLTQTVVVAETNVSYVSATDYTSVIKELTAAAETQVATGATPTYVAATFTGYHGRFADETTKERGDLARHYEQEVAILQQRRFVAEQTAKGLVESHGEWITPEEKVKREVEESRASEEQSQHITGAFGVNLGTEVRLSDYQITGTTSDGTILYGFAPRHPIKELTAYHFAVTPKTSIIYSIWAGGDEMPEEACMESVGVVLELLKKRYGDVPKMGWFDMWTVERGDRSTLLKRSGGGNDSSVLLVYTDKTLERFK